jgi:hypothetical protein
MIPAIQWLANTKWTPSWNFAGRPGLPQDPAMLLRR